MEQLEKLSPNTANLASKELIATFVQHELEHLMADIDNFSSEKRQELLFKLLPYALSKPKSGGYQSYDDPKMDMFTSLRI